MLLESAALGLPQLQPCARVVSAYLRLQLAGGHPAQFLCAQAERCCSAAVSFAELKAFAATPSWTICAALGTLPGCRPAFANAWPYALKAVANVWKSPRISEGAALAIACRSFASFATVAEALPAVGCMAVETLAPSAANCAQLCVLANVGAAEVDVDP
jgi:hypothetical protein